MNDNEGERYRNYSGKVVLLRAKQKLPGVRWDPALGWSSWFQSPVDVQVVPGEHESILFGPRIAKVASILNNYLVEAHQHQSGSGENA